MHTNDTHANLDHVAKKMAAIKDIRALKPNALLVDAGDVLTGTLFFNEYKGLADLEFMNLAGYDAMTFGNHEFDLGTATLANFVSGAQFPFVSANVNFSQDNNLKSRFSDTITLDAQDGQIYNGMIKVVNGEKIGIFGLTTAETPTISSPGAGVVFENYIQEAQKAVNSFKALGVNKIVALSHLGLNDSAAWDNDLELAKAVEGIDVIVGGHTHVKLDAPMIDRTGAEPTVIVQANEYNKFLGDLDVTFDEAGIVMVGQTTGRLVDVYNYAKTDAAVKQVLDTKYLPKIAELKATVVGSTATALVGGNPPARVGETNLGNFIADGMLAKAKTINANTVIALQNGGGVRETIAAGNITLENVFKVLPFGNTLAIMNLKGSEIKLALEHGVKTAPTTANGAFLQVAGLRFTYDSNAAVGEKVKTIEVKNADGSYTALDLTKNYYVATNIFTAKGGDGFSMFATAYAEGRVSEPGFVDWEMFRDYIAAQPNGVVNATVEGRISNVTTVTVEAFSGTTTTPKAYTGNVVGDTTGVVTLKNATVAGDLFIEGNSQNVTLENVIVQGDTIFVD
jgi:2',3'-cyclic-nucleotide 2'-phosphodiesterase (5'-nucleotidase family)